MELPPINPEWESRRDVRREYREEREDQVFPLMEDRRIAQRAAIEFGQNLLKTIMILNGGALLGTPAMVSLFKIDTETTWRLLAATGGCFILGIIATLCGWICAFFSQARLSDEFHQVAAYNTALLDRAYQRLPENELASTMASTAASAIWNMKSFLRHRRAAIVLIIIATVFFVAGAVIGGVTVMTTPHKLLTSGVHSSSDIFAGRLMPTSTPAHKVSVSLKYCLDSHTEGRTTVFGLFVSPSCRQST